MDNVFKGFLTKMLFFFIFTGFMFTFTIGLELYRTYSGIPVAIISPMMIVLSIIGARWSVSKFV